MLPAAEMLDPRNGEMMGNSTAYPICTLLEKMPVIKARSLKEDEANQDSLARTCSVLAHEFPGRLGSIVASITSSTSLAGIHIHRHLAAQLRLCCFS